MGAVVDRCHACGTRRAGDERLCAKCGSELSALPPKPELPPAPVDGLTWSYSIPILNNRYVWVRWGWTALAFGAGFAALLGTLLVVMFASGNGGVMFAMKVYVVIALIAALAVLALGLFAALAVGNGVTSRFTLSSQGAVATTTENVSDSVESAALLLGGSFKRARDISTTASLLLPSSGEAKWKDVRRAEFDERRHVITLRRRWHHPLRIHVPPERFSEAAAFVRDQVPTTALRG